VTYGKNLSWNMLIEDGKLLITKGADEIYLIEEIAGDAADNFYNSYVNDSIHELQRNTTDDHVRDAITKLVKVGVIIKENTQPSSSSSLFFSINWIGNSVTQINSLLEQFALSSKEIHISNVENSATLLVLIRNSSTLAEVTKEYEKISIPHLFVDLAYDHTLSFGPFVFPGETACLNCFVGRITRNWGDAKPPEQPEVSRSYELISSLIIEQIRRFQKIGSCPELIEKVWSMNLHDFTTKTDSLFRLPWCPTCYPEKPKEGMGSFELPWKLKPHQL